MPIASYTPQAAVDGLGIISCAEPVHQVARNEPVDTALKKNPDLAAWV
jgi:hypothetical protein